MLTNSLPPDVPIEDVIDLVADRVFDADTAGISRIDFRKTRDSQERLLKVDMQLGSTMVFLRRPAFDKLEMLRASALGVAATKIQSVARMRSARVSFYKALACIFLIQRQARVRLAR